MKRRRTHVDHAAAAARLKAKPGEWDQVAVYPATYSAAAIARTIRVGGNGSRRPDCYIPAGAFEARTVQVEDGTAVEARYVGDAP